MEGENEYLELGYVTSQVYKQRQSKKVLHSRY